MLPAAMLATTSFCFQYVFVASPHIRDALLLSEGDLGWLLSSMFLAGMPGSLVCGWLADAGHTRLALVGSATVVVAGFAVCALPPSYILYLSGTATMGFGLHGLSTLCNTIVVRECAGETRRAVTVLQISAAAAGAISPVLWAWAIEWASGSGMSAAATIQTLFAIGAAGCALVLPVSFRIGVGTRPNAPDKPSGSKLAGGVGLAMVCIFVALHTGADNALYVWAPDFATRRFDPSPFPVAWIISAFSGAYLVGRLVLVSLPERIGDLTLLGIASGLGAVLSLFAFQSESQYVLTLLYTLAGVAMSIDYPSIMAHIGRQFPHSTGRVMALAGAVSGGAGFLVPPAMGYIGEMTGNMVAGMMLPVAMLATLSAAAFVWRWRVRAHSSASATTPSA